MIMPRLRKILSRTHIMRLSIIPVEKPRLTIVFHTTLTISLFFGNRSMCVTIKKHSIHQGNNKISNNNRLQTVYNGLYNSVSNAKQAENANDRKKYA